MVSLQLGIQILYLDEISELTTTLIIGEFKDMNRFDNIKQLTAYYGLNLTIRQSGSSLNSGYHISK